MNVTDAPLQANPIPASTPPSRRLPIAFESQAELAVPLTSVHRVHSDSNGPHGATAPVTDLVVEATLTPYSHWGINE
jgi:hypothetical protein